MNKTYITAAVSAALLSGGLFAQALVTVNGQAVDSSVIDAQVKAIRADDKNVQDTSALRRNLINRLVLGTVVGQEAKRLKLDQSAEYKKTLTQAREAAKKSGADKKAGFQAEWGMFESDLLGQAYAIHIARSNPVQEKDVKTAYAGFEKFYKGTQEVQLGEISARSTAEAGKAVAELGTKKSFAEVFKKYSADESAKKAGGVWGDYVPLKDLQQSAPPIYAAVKDLKKGGYTAKPLQNGRFHTIFYVLDRRDIKVPSYEQVKNTIRRDLTDARVDAAVQSLMKKAVIKSAK
ncbi:peptidylprolyl isomerase [Neisseria chenwenguii]|uniref:peptidylprolyl isomerase n=1 Tax=Neisseria chenwenguii TaxID=1853278 RepID=UPI000F4F71BB|nr:peptidylprolyl isomerase [Neisseria chenwenguii]ROV55514.1 hypothetical protein EGS38_09170 [Neisseria chenwenguii]